MFVGDGYICCMVSLLLFALCRFLLLVCCSSFVSVVCLLCGVCWFCVVDCCLVFGVWCFGVRCVLCFLSFVFCFRILYVAVGVCCLLLVARCSLFVMCSLSLVVDCCLLFVGCWLLLVVRCMLIVLCCSLIVVRCLMCLVCCLFFVVYCLVSVVRCLILRVVYVSVLFVVFMHVVVCNVCYDCFWVD